MGIGCTGRWYIGGGVKYPVELAARLLKAGRKADPGDVKLLIHETKKYMTNTEKSGLRLKI